MNSRRSTLKIFILLTSMCNTQILAEIKIGKFPDDFLFGAATSALQVEGAWDDDGKGPSVWDELSEEHPEAIADGSNTNDTADSYYFYEEDIKAVKSMGVCESDTFDSNDSHTF